MQYMFSNIVPYIIGTDRLLTGSIYLSAGIMILILVVSVSVLVIKEERKLPVIFLVLILGPLGTISSSYAGMHGMNMSLDS